MKYIQLAPTDKLPDIEGLRPCKAVVIIETTINPAQRASISRWLVKSGCLYIIAWGDDCASWEESVQLANREAFATPEIPDQSLIITTWHDDEPLKDVFWFAKYTAIHPCHKLDNVLLLHLSTVDREQELCAEYASV